jgi:hypothetical protein
VLDASYVKFEIISELSMLLDPVGCRVEVITELLIDLMFRQGYLEEKTSNTSL